jgi:hypothetical protein
MTQFFIFLLQNILNLLFVSISKIVSFLNWILGGLFFVVYFTLSTLGMEFISQNGGEGIKS